MKKVIFSILCLMICIALVGCTSNNDAETINKLSTQLDRVESVVSSTSTSEVNEVSPYTRSALTSSDQISILKNQAYSKMTLEEDVRQEVLAMNSYLKDCTKKSYRLGNQKNSSINDLTGNISKYLNYLNSTKADVQTHVEKIKKSSTARSYSLENTKSSYISLVASMDERITYLNNIYNSLGQIANILDDSLINNNNDTTSNTETINQSNSQNTNLNTQSNTNQATNSENQNEKGIIRKNIDTYNKARNNDTKVVSPETNNANTIDYNGMYGYNGYGYDNVNGYYNGYGYNNGYGFNNGYYPYYNSPFNPGRNTDTFYPRMKNIDTYRYNPNQTINNGGYGAYPIAPATLPANTDAENSNLENTKNTETANEKTLKQEHNNTIKLEFASAINSEQHKNDNQENRQVI